MRNILIANAISIVVPITITAVPVVAEAPAATGFSVDNTDLGSLLDNADAKAILMKYIPAVVGNDQISMARSLTLKQLQQYAGDSLTDDALAKIQADLSKLPAKH